MKFIHMADMHFDAPFVALANKDELAKQRRLEQRTVMKSIVEYIYINKIPYFFIAGDLYEHEYITKSTIDFINNLFKTINNTKIFITPGNHDPYLNNSFYKQYKWNENVYIFRNELEVVENNEVDIYGYGFNNFSMQSKNIKINIKDKNKINIFITHGTLDGNNIIYNPINSKEIKKIGFDYIALGHIHKKSYNDYENQNIVYPGSTVSLGFDELGNRGIIEGTIDENKKLHIKFLPVNSKSFEEKILDISEINSFEELIERINSEEINENSFYKIILEGKKKFEININELSKLVEKNNIIKIKDASEIKYNIDEISTQVSLKGLFAKRILEKINKEDISEEEKNDLHNAFEIGMNVLNKR